MGVDPVGVAAGVVVGVVVGVTDDDAEAVGPLGCVDGLLLVPGPTVVLFRFTRTTAMAPTTATAAKALADFQTIEKLGDRPKRRPAGTSSGTAAIRIRSWLGTAPGSS